MGRKERNKINDKDKDNEKEKNKAEEQQEENDYIEEQELVFQLEQNQYDGDITEDTRINMIDYCDKACIPLCDYLTMDVFEKFVEYLKNPS